jgi:precorrin-6B methylase 2
MADIIEVPNTNRELLASLLHELGLKTGVEVGVQVGAYSEVLCKYNPQMKVYGIDPWVPYSGMKDGSLYLTKRRADKFFRMTERLLAPYPNYEIIRDYSMEAVKRFADESLDFVYIDGDHRYQFVLDDITEWTKKIRKGGLISGHDYYQGRANKRSIVEVKPALLDYVRKNNVKPLFIWGSKAALPGELRDHCRSWSFVKV